MAEQSQEKSRPADSGVVTLVTSPDVAATIGRSGLLENRAGVAAIKRITPMRSDALLDHFRNHPPRAGVVIGSLIPDLTDAEPLTPAQTIANLTEVAAVLATNETTLFVFNVSTYDPTNETHAYAGTPDTFAMRAHRLLVELEKHAGEAGIHVIDIDGAVAEVGGRETVPAPGCLAGDAIDFITEEAILAIDQSGALGGTIQAPVMRVVVPSFDRRTKVGTILRWQVGPGAEVEDGDALFDVQFETRVHRFDLGNDDETRSQAKSKGRSQKAERFQVMDVTVVAGSNAYIHDIVLPEGSPVNAGDIAAIVTTTPGDTATAADAGADFRVGARIVEQ